jgi:hypothetical protein
MIIIKLKRNGDSVYIILQQIINNGPANSFLRFSRPVRERMAGVTTYVGSEIRTTYAPSSQSQEDQIKMSII